MAQRNILEVAPLQSYNQTLNYYNRVTNDSGTLIVPYDVDRIYHALNLLSLQNRSYKLYHASAGLQKTDDQIDKIYDLGKDQIDQTFSGSDRPEHIQAWSNSEGVGNWQINVEKEATNYCKESNDLGGIFGGNWTKTEGAGDGPFGDANEAVEVEMNTDATVNSNRINLSVDSSTTFSSGDYLTVSFYAKKISGSTGNPLLLIRGEDNNNNFVFGELLFITNSGAWEFYQLTGQWTGDSTLTNGFCRIQDNDTSADTVYQFWGMQIERGQYATSRIHTDGGIATRLGPIVTLNNAQTSTDRSVAGANWMWVDFVPTPNNPRLDIWHLKDSFLEDRVAVDGAERVSLEFQDIGGNVLIDSSELTLYERFVGFISWTWEAGVLKGYYGKPDGTFEKKFEISYDDTVPFDSVDWNLGAIRQIEARLQSVRYYKISHIPEFLSDQRAEEIFEATRKALFE